jgi:acyl-coenzyme A synthetase/AMP-(fatty) acid ligase
MQEIIAKETIHALVIQPTLLNLLLDEHNNSSGYPLRSLRHIVSSGEKLFTSTAEGMCDVCVVLPFHQFIDPPPPSCSFRARPWPERQALEYVWRH